MNRKVALTFAFIIGSTSALFAQTRIADGRSREGRSTMALLNERIPEVSFEDASFERVMEWVADFTGANVVVRWQTLEDSGVDRDRPISIRVRDLRLSQVLWMIMNEASGADLKLAYRASGNLIVLSTEEDLGKEMVTLVYDISDLLVRVPRFTNAAQLDPAQALQGLTQGGGGGVGGGGGGGGGGGQQLFQNTNQGNEGNDVGGNEIEELVDLIRQTIEPDSWQDNGGNGSIRAFRNLLIVRNTLLVHQRINGPVSE